MAIEKIVPKESRGDDPQFECVVAREIWIVSLHFDAALIAPKNSTCTYFSKGGENDIGWGVRYDANGRHWKPVIDPTLINLLDSLHFACIRKDETESATPKAGEYKLTLKTTHQQICSIGLSLMPIREHRSRPSKVESSGR